MLVVANKFLTGYDEPLLHSMYVNILAQVKKDAAYQTQVLNNPDEQNRRIALESLIGDAINKERRRELELYKLYAGDSDFKRALNESLIRILALQEKQKSA